MNFSYPFILKFIKSSKNIYNLNAIRKYTSIVSLSNISSKYIPVFTKTNFCTETSKQYSSPNMNYATISTPGTSVDEVNSSIKNKNTTKSCSSDQEVDIEKTKKNTSHPYKRKYVSKSKIKAITDDIPLSDYSFIIFDLETSGLRIDCEILQIGAVCGDSSFNVYINPLSSIDMFASCVHNLTSANGLLLYNDEVVESFPLEEAIKKFLCWMGEMPFQSILIGHNIKTFDCPRLMRAIIQCNLLHEFSMLTCGFVDTLPLFRKLHPELKNHKQTTVVKHLTGLEYESHNALADVTALQKAFYKNDIPESTMLSHSFTFNSYMSQYTSKYG